MVYKLPYSLSGSFQEIFLHVDADPASFGIKSYTIRNMTLEQVFIAIGEEELQRELKQDGETASAEEVKLIDDLPELTKPSFCALLKFQTISMTQSYLNTGVLAVLCGISIYLIFAFLVAYLPLIMLKEG